MFTNWFYVTRATEFVTMYPCCCKVYFFVLLSWAQGIEVVSNDVVKALIWHEMAFNKDVFMCTPYDNNILLFPGKLDHNQVQNFNVDDTPLGKYPS